MNSDTQTAGALLDAPANTVADQATPQASKARYVAPALVSIGSANRETAAGLAGIGDGPTLS